ncbi:hypothetical protein BGZ99_000812 [Dissophora globulifera]|uniref:Uncharacterized protein n=1 Tax=Dissophora globulifera TaxID=979702 RepID=A0A9P6UY29_9FUNG|nr:hypothetical protein BGZ99_000812 [Dissophora globulifera]
MSVVQTVSERLAKKQPVESTVDKPTALDTTYVAPESLPKTHSPSRRSHYTQRLSEIFRYNKAVDSESQECVSSSGPPPQTAWDTPEEATDSKNSLLLQEQRQSWRTNTAFNLETIKMLLNSPLFSNFVKSLTVMAAVSILAIALDAIHLLRQHDGVTEAAASPLMNANASLYITVVLSILTIAYSCFTIFLDSRRPPEGLDSSDSKPFIVIFFEIMASTIWAQVLSVSIFLYTWTLGCSDAGARQMDELLSPFLEVAEETRYHYLVARMCRREGTMVGLELLLVLLLIFNFYTHLAQNFQFIRAVSR